jgi:excisionase family DNA binding protein
VNDQRTAEEHLDGGDPAPQWLSTKQAAAYLGIIPRTLYRLIDSGQLPAYRFGRVIRLQRHQIDAFIDTARIQPGSLQHLYSDTTDIIDGDTADTLDDGELDDDGPDDEA